MDVVKTKISNEIEVQHALHLKGGKVYVRFYVLHKSIRIHETLVSTGVSADPKKWCGGTVNGRDVATQLKNERIREVLDIVRDALHEMKKLKDVAPSTVQQELEQGVKPKVTSKPPRGQRANYLSRLADHKLSAVKDSYLSTVEVTETYRKNFRLAVQKFCAWWKLSHPSAEPMVNEITETDMKRFKTWLCKQPSIKHNTASTYISRLRTIFLHAVDQNLVAKSPIPRKGFIEGYKKGTQVALTVEELNMLRGLSDSILTESERKVKYIFLFLCSTGMGYGELKSLRLHHIEQEGGEFTITKERNKTGEEFSLPLSETAKQIYTNFFLTDGEPFANLPSIEYVTRIVKRLATKAGITKNLTTYVGRKSFATEWTRDGNNLYFLSMILGHTRIETTMKYVNVNKQQMLQYSREAMRRNAFHTQPIFN